MERSTMRLMMPASATLALQMCIDASMALYLNPLSQSWRGR
jgi:hypothetical protein